MPLDTRFDKRLIERNLRKGIITQAEYEKHVNSLPDVEHKSTKLNVNSIPKVNNAFLYDDDDDDEDEDDEDDEDE